MASANLIIKITIDDDAANLFELGEAIGELCNLIPEWQQLETEEMEEKICRLMQDMLEATSEE